jgi:hypothetical protein
VKYQKIINKLQEVGFDRFYQAGCTSIFHPMNIVAESKITDKQYWICVDSGYRSPETFHIAYRELNNINAKETRIYCRNQSEMIEQLSIIQSEIALLKTA